MCRGVEARYGLHVDDRFHGLGRCACEGLTGLDHLVEEAVERYQGEALACEAEGVQVVCLVLIGPEILVGGSEVVRDDVDELVG